MRKLFSIFTAVLLTATLWAQSPQKMSYQAVIHNSSDQLVTNQTVGMQISILQGSASGTVVYTETQTPTTNANGLVSIEIGGGSGFNAIDWSAGPYFIETKTDPTGGTNYTITGTSQLLSVPYALHAKTVETVNYSQITGTPTIPSDIADLTDNSGLLFDGNYNSLSNLPTLFDGNYNSLTNLPTLFSGSFTDLTNKPTTIAGYGITDAFDGTWTSLTGKPTFATVATSGSYNDLSDKPTIPTAADGSETKLTAGTNITITGSGTTASPYVINATGGGTRYLGEEYLGGIIFYLYTGSDGQQHGLVVSKTETSAQWQSTTSTTNANRTEDGSYNTGVMTNSPAKTWVTGLGAGWYLPSIDELGLLWHNRYHVNKTARSIGSTLLSGIAYYWSSTEYDAIYAFFFYFFDGYALNYSKTYTYSVRGVRAF